MTSFAPSPSTLGLFLLLSATPLTGCGHKCPPPPKPLPAVVTTVEKLVPCMGPMHSNLPDDKKWAFYAEAKGDILKGSATLPPTEVLAVFNLIDYLATQLAACNAVKTP